MITIYFSGTGNSKYIAKQFSKRMDCDCYSIEEKTDFKSILNNTDKIAVVYPIYGSCVPRIMGEFVEN